MRFVELSSSRLNLIVADNTSIIYSFTQLIDSEILCLAKGWAVHTFKRNNWYSEVRLLVFV